MADLRNRFALILPLIVVAACTSATDRLNEGVTLQQQGRYMEAVYRYADAVDRDPELVEARERLIAVGDTAIDVTMDDADDLERRGDPVASATLYRDIDRMLARVRQVGVRLDPPADYMAIRRAVFDNAIRWQMARGDESAQAGRWEEARRYYVGARTDFLEPTRIHIEESYDAEVRVLLDWSEVELADGSYRSAHALAQEALEVRSSPARDIVLRVRDIQERALDEGSVVVAVLPVTGDAGVRNYLGAEFEVELDEALGLDHWNEPPLFVEIADPIILRRELRGLLRGQVTQSPTIVGRALDLIGADLAAMISLSRIDVTESDVEEETHEHVVARNDPPGLARGRGQGRGQPGDPPGLARGRGTGASTDDGAAAADTVTYRTIQGQVSYYLEAQVVLVDSRGREVERFSASSRQSGPFTRGEFDGDPSILDLDENRRRYFDPDVLGGQLGRIEGALLQDLAVAIASGTFDTVLQGIR